MRTRTTRMAATGVRICVFAACAIVVMTGTAQAQQLILDNGQYAIENPVGTEVARLDAGGDLYLGGGGWYGDIISIKGPHGTTLYWNAGAGDLTIGGGSLGTPSDGDFFMKDSDGVTNTVAIDGNLAYIQLGAVGEDGDIQVKNASNAQTFYIDGATGNVTNTFTGNGVLKAWARIRADGTISSCWRCNTSTAETRKVGTGQYEVDFTPLATSLAGRPRGGVLDTLTTGSSVGSVTVADRAGDVSSIWVATFDGAGTYTDRAFTLLVF